MQENYLGNTVQMCVVYFETHWKKDELMDESGNGVDGWIEENVKARI